MENALQLSFILQAAAIAGLCFAVFLLVRNLRYLHAKLPAAGALMLSGGPRVGSPAPQLSLQPLSGKLIAIGGAAPKASLLFFFSPSCPVSKAMMPVVKSFGAEHAATMDTFFATDGEEQGHGRVVEGNAIRPDAYIVSEQLGMAFGIGRVPQAVLIGKDGTIVARGLINTREHLESLLNASASQIESLQEHLAKQAL